MISMFTLKAMGETYVYRDTIYNLCYMHTHVYSIIISSLVVCYCSIMYITDNLGVHK